MDVLQNAFHLEAVANGPLGTSKTTWETSEFETLPLMFSAQICYFKRYLGLHSNCVVLSNNRHFLLWLARPINCLACAESNAFGVNDNGKQI